MIDCEFESACACKIVHVFILFIIENNKRLQSVHVSRKKKPVRNKLQLLSNAHASKPLPKKKKSVHVLPHHLH